MQNWYCLVHFPDDSQSVHLIPGPAPVYIPGEEHVVVKIAGKPGQWLVRDVSARVTGEDYAAEIWVEPREPDG